MKRLSLKAGTVERARQLRREMTPQERLFWRGLKESFPDRHFRKQVPLGAYYADFVCHKAKLVIEVDGGQHSMSDAINYDEDRTRFLASQGFRVIRFWNADITSNFEGVMSMVGQELVR